MPPKLFIDGSTPTPTYDSTASYRISDEKSSTVTISIRCATFGKMWRAHDARVADAEALAACTYSSSRSFSVSPRSSRHSAGPAGQAQHRAQQEQLQVGALGAGLEQLRVLVEEHLHHQHAGGDQQHVRAPTTARCRGTG